MKVKLKIILAFCLSITILFIAGIYSYKSTNDYKNASAWVSHTQHVISDIESILLNVQGFESSQRGYAITGSEKYLIPYQKDLVDVEAEYINLKQLIQYNSSQSALLDSINEQIEEKILFSKEVIEARQKQGVEAAENLINTDRGQNLMVKIRGLVDRFIANEKELLSERLISEKQNFSATLRIIVLSIGFSIIIVLITMYFFIMDYNKRIRSEKKLIESELQLKKFLDSMPLGIYIMRPGRIPYYQNTKLKTLFGMNINPDAGYKVYVAGTNQEYPPERLPVIRALNGEENIFIEDIEVEMDGQNRRIPLRINAAPVTNLTNEIDFAIAVFEDITDVKETEKNLIAAKKLAEQSSNLKEAFLANMSHEIRTPMNAIIGFTDLLLKKELGLQEMEYVQTIKNSGENLMRIINDVLDVSKIDSGMMTFEEHPINITELFSSISTMLSEKAKAKKLSLTFYSDANVPDSLLGDPVRLTQIIINLVGNAIKFTKQGSVTVFAKILEEDADTYRIEFSVKDTGIGIPEDKIQSIFERFRQAESYTTRNYGGTGLGLSIAKQLVELQGGTIDIKSKVNEGSVFMFTLPFRKTTEINKVIQKKTSEINISELSKLKILLAEDNPVNVKFVMSLFSEYGIYPEVVENGKLAVEKLKEQQYDLILMDMEMPEMSGYQATIVIRNELRKDTPIIAMTAHAMAGEREKCLQLGMNEYISKPIKSELLFEKMILVIDQQKENNSTTYNHKITDLDFLIKSMNGKNDAIRETMNVFLEQMPEDLSKIDNAIKLQDYTGVEKLAHRMKSTVSLMGITMMENVLERMEKEALIKSDFEKIEHLLLSLKVLNEQAMLEIKSEKMKY